MPQARRFQGYIRGISVSSQDGIHGKASVVEALFPSGLGTRNPTSILVLQKWLVCPSLASYSSLSCSQLLKRQSRLPHRISHLSVSIRAASFLSYNTHLAAAPCTLLSHHYKALPPLFMQRYDSAGQPSPTSASAGQEQRAVDQARGGDGEPSASGSEYTQYNQDRDDVDVVGKYCTYVLSSSLCT